MAAGQTKTVANSATGSVTTYVITDGSGNTVTIVANQLNAGGGEGLDHGGGRGKGLGVGGLGDGWL